MLVTCHSERSPVRALTSFKSPSTTLHWHLASVVSRRPGYERRRSNAAATSVFGSITCAFWSNPVESKFRNHEKYQSWKHVFCRCHHGLRDVSEAVVMELSRKWRLPTAAHQRSLPFQPILDSKHVGFRSTTEWVNILLISEERPIVGLNFGRRK